MCASAKYFLLNILFVCSQFLAKTEPFVIARKGEPVSSIVLKRDYSQEVKSVATELQSYLEKITGAKIPIQQEKTQNGNILIALSQDVPELAEKYKMSELDGEGFVVVCESNSLCIVGNSELAISHAVFAFLESVGCRWFFPESVWTIIPKNPDLSVQPSIRTQPFFKYRRIWYGYGARTPKLRDDYNNWLIHNRQPGAFVVDCGHSYERYIPKSLFNEHPEWFSLVNGKRTPTQLCVSNPELQKYLIEQVLGSFRKNPSKIMASIEPNDGGGYCECQDCKEIGTISDRTFYLANIVADAVRKEFPDKWVGLLAYAYHSDPPKFKLSKGVYVEITTGFRYTSLSFEEQAEAFRKLGALVGVYDYFSVYPWDYDLPGKAKAGRYYSLAKAIKHYSDLKFVSYTAESSCNWGPNGPGYWIASKLMWAPGLDARELLNDFYEKSFGSAKSPMARIYERFAKGERPSPRHIKLALNDLRDALNMANTEEERTRILRVGMYLHWLKLRDNYDRSARWNQWGKLVFPQEEIEKNAKELIHFSRRIMDTGLIHTHPMLFGEWFEQKFAALKKLNLDKKVVEEWKQERKDIPLNEEVLRLIEADIQSLRDLNATELSDVKYSGRLIPIIKVHPELVREWGAVKRSPLFVESGEHYFIASKNEQLNLTYKPYDAGHTVNCKWTLRSVEPVNQLILSGEIKAEKGKSTNLSFTVPYDGVYVLEPGTGYWKASEIGFDERPLSVLAEGGDREDKDSRRPFVLWLPRNEPLYFYVPQGTKSFVIAIASGGDPFTDITLKTADGVVRCKERVVSGEEISVILKDNGSKPIDGKIWSVSISSLRCGIELYGVPPFLARHPAELIVTEESLRDKNRNR